jgi:Collagen triple helix repeat (20 copies)
MKSNGTWFRTIYVSTIMIVIGLSVIQSPMYSANGNANEVYGKEYSNSFDATASSVNSCSLDVVCAINSHQILVDGTASTPIMQISGGAQGAQGPKGDTGDTGPQGLTGPKGGTGDTGPQGPQGLTGAQGPQGLTGPQGNVGPQGPQGLTGVQGPQGLTGAQGPQGVAGPQGSAGAPGAQGAAGPPGTQGEQGAPGPDKKLEVRESHGASVTVPPGGTSFAIARCNPDEVVTGGGIRVAGAGNTINPTDEFSAELNTQPTEWWHAYTNPGPNAVPIEAYAECAKLVDVP